MTLCGPMHYRDVGPARLQIDRAFRRFVIELSNFIELIGATGDAREPFEPPEQAFDFIASLKHLAILLLAGFNR